MNDVATTEPAIDPEAALAPSGQPWGWGVRTVDAHRRAHKGFQWPSAPGSIVVAPDWDSEPRCGGGLHFNPYGMGDWALVSRDRAAIWQLVKYDPAVCVAFDGGELGGKLKAPWVVLARDCGVGDLAGLMAELAQRRTERLKTLLQRPETPSEGVSSTTGDYAHSSTTGCAAHSSTTGGRAHSSTTGDDAIAASLGFNARAKAGAGGAIVLSEFLYDGSAGGWKLAAVFASKVGENGIEPDVWYELKDGKPVAVQA